MVQRRKNKNGMRLRKTLKQPVRYEEEDINNRRPYQKRNGTKPAFPELLAEQSIPYQQPSRPAAFPSLPLDGSQAVEEDESDGDESTAVREKSLESEPIVYTPATVNQLLDGFSSAVAEGDSTDRHDDPGQDKHMCIPSSELIEWTPLELAYRYRIFTSLYKVRANLAGLLLRLSPQEEQYMREALSWRQEVPFTLVQLNDAQNTEANCLEPDVLMTYSDVMVQIAHFELGSFSQLLQAARYLQQYALPIDLLGTWISDPLGSGQLVDITVLMDRFSPGRFTAQQLQSLSVQASRGERVRLQVSNAPIVAPRQLARPKKQKAPVTLQARARTLKKADHQRMFEQTAGRDDGESITVTKRRTGVAKPVPATDTQVSPFVQNSSEDLAAGRSSGSMSLRSRESLKETEAMSALRKDRDFWEQASREASVHADSDDTAVEPIQSHQQATELQAPPVTPRRSMIVKLKVNSIGHATLTGMESADYGQSYSTAAPAESPVTPSRHPNVGLPEWSGSEPHPGEDDVHAVAPVTPERRIVTLPVLSLRVKAPDASTTFAAGINAECGLQQTPPQETVIDDNDVAGSVDQFQTARSRLPSSPTMVDEPGMQNSPSFRLSSGVIGAISTGPEDVEMADAPVIDQLFDQFVELEPLVLANNATEAQLTTAAGVEPTTIHPQHEHQVATPKARLKRNNDFGEEKSPVRPGSVSPISVNDDDLEYQAFLRGDELPRLGELLKQLQQRSAAEKEDPQVTKEPLDALYEQVSLAEHEGQESTTLGTASAKKELKVTLKVRVPEDMFLSGAQPERKASVPLPPDDDSDSSFVEEKPSKKKQKIGTKKSQASTKSLKGSQPKAATRKSGAHLVTSKAAPAFKQVIKPSERQTRASSVAVSEMSGTTAVDEDDPHPQVGRSLRSGSVAPVTSKDNKKPLKSLAVPVKDEKAPSGPKTGMKRKKTEPKETPAVVAKTTQKAPTKGTKAQAKSSQSKAATAQVKPTPIKAASIQPTQKKAPPEKAPRARASQAKATNVKEKSSTTVKASSAKQSQVPRRSSRLSSVETINSDNSDGEAPALPQKASAKVGGRGAGIANTKTASAKNTPVAATVKKATVPEAASEPATALMKQKEVIQPPGHRPRTRAQTPLQSVLEQEAIVIHDTASEAESETTVASTKSRRPWTKKHYVKSRESSRLAEKEGN